MLNIDKQFLSSTFQWPVIMSSNSSALLSSIYLITATVENGLLQERVLGLVATNQVKIAEPDVCKFTKLNEGKMFKLNVYAINFNGYNKKNFFSSDFSTFKKASGVLNVSVTSPGTYIDGYPGDTEYIGWNITWSEPKDMSSVANQSTVKTFTLQPACLDAAANYTLDREFTPHEDSFPLDRSFGSFQVINPKINNIRDRLRGCKVRLNILTKVGSCSAGPVAYIEFIYTGCQNVVDFQNCSQQIPTPKPTDAPISGQNISIIHAYCNTSVNATCLNSCYNMTLMWNVPKTSSPIEKYILRYGKAAKFKEYSFIDKEDKKFDLYPNTTSYSLLKCITVDTEYGFQVYTITATGNGEGIYGKGYAFLNLKVLPLAAIPTLTTTLKGKSISVAIIAGIIVPLVVFTTGLILFCVWQKRRHHSFMWNKDFFGNYIETQASKKNLDEWEIFPEDVCFGEKIGEGAFGAVFIATIKTAAIMNTKYVFQQPITTFQEKYPDRDTYKVVAVKRLKEAANECEFSDFRDEIAIMKIIGYHKNVVNMIGCSTIKKPLCLVVEYMENGDLLTFLRHNRATLCSDDSKEENVAGQYLYTKDYHAGLKTDFTLEIDSKVLSKVSYSKKCIKITPTDLLSFAWQIASGMEYLVKANLVHRDLAARNILVGAEKNVKISDFGLTRKVTDELIYMSSRNRRLPVKWMSLEAIFEQLFTSCSDVWSYGILLFEIVTLGGTPYPSISNRELLGLLKSGYRMVKPDNCGDLMYDIMQKCWNENPLQRPTFTQLREHFAEIIAQENSYFSFDIDEQKNYYNAASFNSISSASDECDLDKEIESFMEKPIQVKESYLGNDYTQSQYVNFKPSYKNSMINHNTPIAIS